MIRRPGLPEDRVEEPIPAADRRHLLAVARGALEEMLADDRKAPVPIRGEAGPGIPHHGVFVTLRHGPDLRGCIGNLDAGRPLAEAVRECAIAAAADPRFDPLRPGELSETFIEISVLGTRRRVAGPREIEPGLDGLVVTSGTKRGLLLPQVAAEHGWDAERLLDETCRKAGLQPGAWRSGGAVVEAFRAEIFSEAT